MTATQLASVGNPRPAAGINFDPMTLADPTHVDRVHRDAVLSEVHPASVALPPARAPLKNHSVAAGVTELLSAYSSGSLQPSQLLDQLKARIEAARTGREAVLRFAPGAEQAARESDRRIAEGRARPLEGIPFGVKDIIDVADTIVTSGSHFTGDRVAAVDAPAVAALRAAGAIPFAITATTEFATGSPYNPRYGTVTNPYDRRRWTGGSSTGSGAALAARLMPLALGTDTGGSIRVPSCWCGTTGLKPSRELISRQGVAPLSWTLDHVGPMARSAEDIARVLPFMLHRGGGRLASEIAALLTNGSVRGLRLGVPVNWFTEKVEQRVLANWQAALRQFEALGCRLVPLPHIDVEPLHEAGWVILQSELASLHAARLDRAELFDPGLLHRLKNGLGYSARDYGEALQRRTEALASFLLAMRDVDALITPGLGGEAGHLEDLTVDIDGERHAFQTVISRNTMIFDVTGLPALMVPSGVGLTGLPTGIQVVGHPGGDALCLRLGQAFQEVTDFHRMMPPEDAL